MSRKLKLSTVVRMGLGLAILGATGLAAAPQAAAQESVAYTFQGSFNSGPDGASPEAELISDASGNLYGTTAFGGSAGLGAVFELSPSGGGWTESILYNFQNNGVDGQNPAAALVFDKNGNLYGTTINGGNSGVGTVFELSPKRGGGWTESVIYAFQNNGVDGNNPYCAMIFDATGNMYGTTSGGGTGPCTAEGGNPGCGTIFELSPKSGSWTETILQSFQGSPNDGYLPLDGVVFDNSGNLYGTTIVGGSLDAGAVFELSPKAGGGWNEGIIYSFLINGRDGNSPSASLLVDAAGNLFGTTGAGGASCGLAGCGTIFEMSPKTGGGWTEKVLHSFNSFDGAFPEGDLHLDSAGNLFGTTQFGGSGKGNDCSGCGTVYELLAPAVHSGLSFRPLRVLHNFQDNGVDGINPAAGVIEDSSGNLYGTTTLGGDSACSSQLGTGCGIVYEISGAAHLR